jgi:hypothetical protein
LQNSAGENAWVLMERQYALLQQAQHQRQHLQHQQHQQQQRQQRYQDFQRHPTPAFIDEQTHLGTTRSFGNGNHQAQQVHY